MYEKNHDGPQNLVFVPPSPSMLYICCRCFDGGVISLCEGLHVLVGDRKANWCKVSSNICEDFYRGLQNSSGSQDAGTSAALCRVKIFPHDLISHHSVASMALVPLCSLQLLRHSGRWGGAAHTMLENREGKLWFYSVYKQINSPTLFSSGLGQLTACP